MTWGGQEWGAQEWGTLIDLPRERVLLDGTLSGTITADVGLDAILRRFAEANVGADATLSGTRTGQFRLDFFAGRLATDVLSRRFVRPVLLVELQFPSGTVYATNGPPGKFADKYWSPILVGATDLLRSVDDTLDSVAITLADPNRRVSQNFTDAQPPENALVIISVGSRDDEDENLFEAFRGRVEEVSDVEPAAITLQVVRTDLADDRLIGTLYDATTYPNAPPETIGRMIPLVYGTVEAHEGYLTDYNAKDALDDAVTETATVFPLRDASAFPSSGTGEIGLEQFTWSGKNGNQLTGITRGVNGTQAAPWAEGQDVIERGNLDVSFADHALGSIDTIRIMDQYGDLRKPVPDPAVIDPAAATIRWNQTPRLVIPDVSSTILRAGFQAAGGSNQATNPLFACRENVNYSDLNFASVAASQQLQITRSKTMPPVGSISRVALVVTYDPAGGAGASVAVGNPVVTVGSLSQQDNTPEWAIRRVERTLGVTYDLQDPTHSHTGGIRDVFIRPRALAQLGTWQFHEAAIDDNYITGALLQAWTNLGTQSFPRYDDVPMVFNQAEARIGTDETFTGGWLEVMGGDLAGGGLDSFQVRVGYSQGLPIIAAWHPGGQPKTLVATQFTAAQLAALGPHSNWGNLLWVVDAPARKTAFTCRCSEIRFKLNATRAPAAAATGQSQRRSVSNYFDVTTLVNGDWSWFSDVARGGTVRVANGAGGELRVNNVMYVIEHYPFEDLMGRRPRVFADVTGRIPDGKATEVIKDLLTRATPQGLGLPVGVVAQGLYTTAQDSLDTDGMRVDFAVRQQVPGIQLVRKIADQSDLRQWWDGQVHGLIRRPDVTALPGIFATYGADRILDGTLRMSRTRIDEAATRVEARYHWRDDVGELTRTADDEDAAAEALIGRRVDVVDLDLVRDDTAAATWVTRELGRRSSARWLVRFRLPLLGLDVRRGDLIAVEHDAWGWSFAKAEVLNVTLTTEEELEIEITAIVWEV